MSWGDDPRGLLTLYEQGKSDRSAGKDPFLPTSTEGPGLALLKERMSARYVHCAAAYEEAARKYQAALKDQAAGLGVATEEYEKAVGDAKAVSEASAAVGAVAAAVASGTNAAPIVGQIVAAVAAFVSFVAGLVAVAKLPDRRSLSERQAGANVFSGSPVRQGWEDGCYFFDDAPVFAPKVGDFAQKLQRVIDSEWGAKGWAAFRSLCERYPLGFAEGVRVTVYTDGLISVRRPSPEGEREINTRDPGEVI